MVDIDLIENNLSLHKLQIEIGDIIDDYLSQRYEESDLEKIDKLECRKSTVNQLKNRFSNIYELDILKPENGFSTLNVEVEEEEEEAIKAKRYLHSFLSYKCLTGGTDANTDGSAKLFEDISANAVKNYLGLGSKSIMVGEGRQNLSSEALIGITNELKEKSGVYHNLPNQAKDDGVDFIVYKPLDNREIGNIIILGQACVGKHYGLKKSIHERWKDEYITYAVKPPITLLSVVYYLDSIELRKVHSAFRNSIIFDRGRIMKYFDTNDHNLNDRISLFVTNISED